MEIDPNQMRAVAPGTGDPNFMIDVMALPGKPGGFQNNISPLGGGYDTSNMSPI